MMRILLVNYEYPPLGGGGGIAMMEIAQELARRHEIHVLTSGVSGLPAVEKHDSLNLTIHRAQVFGRSDRATASFMSMAAFLPAGIRRGNQLIAEYEFDVVNTWFAIPSGITGAAIARKNNVPHVLTVIGGDIYDPSKWYSPHQFFPAGLAVKRVLRQANSHVAISTDIAQRTRDYFGFDSPIEVIPLGIAEPEFKPATREDLGMDSSKKYIVAVGRLVRRKDYPTLFKAVHDLKREDVDLILLGDGPERENLKTLATSLGIGDRVHLKGFVSDEIKYQILSNSDLFTLISLHEGFGVVYLEAMYCGLPVIAADQGGQVDILTDGETGRLVPIGDKDATTQSLRDLLENGQFARRAGDYNRQRFQDFSISNLARRYEDVFDAVRRKSPGNREK
jgi:glycosyltransferase involved in cell wall biosynthesis